MAASNTDKITDVRNAARPNSARATGTRSAGGTSLACDNLAGWPTASKVHFVTYQIDSSSAVIAGTQLDCTGIVSGNTIGSITIKDGTDLGNSVNDVVEMLPTAAWGQDLADALMNQHTRTGAHTTVTATSLTTTGDVAVGGNETIAGNLAVTGTTTLTGATTITALSNPYKFSVYRAGAWTSAATGGILIYDTKTFDTSSNFNTTTGLFTAPIAGYYGFGACVQYVGQNAIIITALAQNSTTAETLRLQEINNSSGSNLTHSGFAVLHCAANDTVGVLVRGFAAGTGGTGSSVTYFQGFLISAT